MTPFQFLQAAASDPTAQVVGQVVGPLGALGLSVWLLKWFMTEYKKEQEQTRQAISGMTSALSLLREAFLTGCPKAADLERQRAAGNNAPSGSTNPGP